MKEPLERIEIPGEEAARERTRNVVRAAFAEREPVAPPSHLPRVAALAAALAVLLAAASSPPGRAVLGELREAVGVKRAQPALFSLPAPGRLLVASDAGVWVVQDDGSKRLLGPYREAGWSPFGRFVVAAHENELVALEPDGDVRWTLARPGVRSPRWAGTETDTRIAYVDRTGVRVVAGDGTGDRLLVRGVRGPIAWRSGPPFVLAYASGRRVHVVDADTGRTIWREASRGAVTTLGWSSDGRRLMAMSARGVVVYDSRGGIVYELGPGGDAVHAAALAPSGQRVAFVQAGRGRSQAWIVPRIRPDASAARRVFAGSGRVAGLTWLGDEWVLLSWPTANQLVFVRANGAGIRAVANVSEQFRSRSFPRIEGWCCTP